MMEVTIDEHQEEFCEPFKFKLPSAVQVSGPSNVGKSVFVAKVLEYRNQMISPPPEVILYCYSTYQAQLFDHLKSTCENQIFFVEGLAQLEKVQFDPNFRHCLVLDDLMHEVGNSEFASTLFTKISHHGNVLIFFITQNIYLKAKHMLTINKNMKYNVVFRNKRFRHELETLARQTLGIRPAQIHAVMDDAANENRFPYLILDRENETPEQKSIVTNVLPDSEYPQAYYYVE
jgi:hypothetical protein